MADLNRSLAACTRCRKLKVKCAGPDTIPCPRCKSTGKECLFVAPRAASRAVVLGQTEHGNSTEQLARIDALEKQVAELTKSSKDEFQRLKEAMQNLIQGSPTQTLRQTPTMNAVFRSPDLRMSHDAGTPATDISTGATGARSILSSGSSPRFEGTSLVTKGILSEGQCIELFEYFHQNCNDTIAFFDAINVSTKTILQTPLLLATICTIGARASHSSLYGICRAESELLIQQTMVGATPDLLSLRAVMIYATWHHANRIWGHAVMLAYELGLHTAALSLSSPAGVEDADTVEAARTWLSLCVVDLINNLNTPFLISNIQKYTKLGALLLTSKYFRTVDYRIMAYLELFGIAAEAKESMSKEMMQANPLTEKTKELFDSFNSKIDSIFHDVCNNVDPLYQTFSRPQDRNRMLIPYSFVRMQVYINGISLHELPPTQQLVDPVRIELMHNSIEAGKMMLRAALQSHNFQKSLQYSIDYSGAILILATNFLSKAVFVAHQYIDVASIVDMFRRVVDLFREADAPEHVATLEKMITKISEVGEHTTSPGWNHERPQAEGVLFDIVGGAAEFVSDLNWHQQFPLFDGFSFDYELSGT